MTALCAHITVIQGSGHILTFTSFILKKKKKKKFKTGCNLSAKLNIQRGERTMGARQSSWRELGQTGGVHANSTQNFIDNIFSCSTVFHIHGLTARRSQIFISANSVWHLHVLPVPLWVVLWIVSRCCGVNFCVKVMNSIYDVYPTSHGKAVGLGI